MISSILKDLLNSGDEAAVWRQCTNVKEIAREARGSKSRIRVATRTFAVYETPEGDAQLARWAYQAVAESMFRGLHEVVEAGGDVDRFCDLLGERLLKGLHSDPWYWCVRTLLLMRCHKALGYVMDAAELSPHGSPGTLNLLARGGDIRHEAARVRRLVARFTGTDHLGEATRFWILAKLGDEDAYQALVDLCFTESLASRAARRAAQALSHIHKWDAPFGAITLVRDKLIALDSASFSIPNGIAHREPMLRCFLSS